MKPALKEGLVGCVDCFAEVEEEMRLQDAWSLDYQDKGTFFAGPLSTAPHRSFCTGVPFTETTVKIPPPGVAQKQPANPLITALLLKETGS